MIDRRTGNIKLTGSLELSSKSKFQLLENQDLGEVQEVRDTDNGYKWLVIKNIKIENKYFIISLCYKEEELTAVEMVVNDERFNLSTDWSSWSEQKEGEDLKKYQNWLEKELGRKTKFRWGHVSASFDPKGGSSSILIEYKEKTVHNKVNSALKVSTIFRALRSIFEGKRE